MCADTSLSLLVGSVRCRHVRLPSSPVIIVHFPMRAQHAKNSANQAAYSHLICYLHSNDVREIRYALALHVGALNVVALYIQCIWLWLWKNSGNINVFKTTTGKRRNDRAKTSIAITENRRTGRVKKNGLSEREMALQKRIRRCRDSFVSVRTVATFLSTSASMFVRYSEIIMIVSKASVRRVFFFVSRLLCRFTRCHRPIITICEMKIRLHIGKPDSAI